MKIEISLGGSALEVSVRLLACWRSGWEGALGHLREIGVGEIAELAELEISLLDDEEMGRVHRDFLGDDAPTDVITFQHGEILIGWEVAKRQALEFGESWEREVALYGLHGMLHLAGYNDIQDDEREEMRLRQEELLARFFGGTKSFFEQSRATD